MIWRKGKADGAKTSLKHGKSTTVRETPTFVIAIHLQHTFGMQFGMRQGEGGPDPEELPAAQVLGHGLRLVFGGLRRRGQRHCLQELELATWVATCGYASSGDLNPPTWLTTQIHPCVETTPRPKRFWVSTERSTNSTTALVVCLVQQVWNDWGLGHDLARTKNQGTRPT